MAARNHPRKTIQQGQSSPGVPNEVVIVTVRLDLPSAVYDSYSRLAEHHNLEVEDILLQQLSRCQDIVGSGIYFNESQKKRLSNIVGHTVSDAEGALQRLETSTAIDVSGFSFELDPRLIHRLKSRVFRGEEYSDVMYREIVRGLMTFAGMTPSSSNTGGWWRRKNTAKPSTAVVASSQANGHAATVAATTIVTTATNHAKECPNGKA